MAPQGELGRVWALPRGLVYRALDTLAARGLVTEMAPERSEAGPQRRRVAATPAGGALVAEWLAEPVEHMRDVRSLLMLKLALLHRSGADPAPLLAHQVERFQPLVRALEQAAATPGGGFEAALALWRLENARAVLRFLHSAAGVRGAAGPWAGR